MEKDEIDLIRVAKPEKSSLLERYDIPVEHLSYEYISDCKNGKILERIVTILRSGEEGTYPDLIRHAEERLAVIKPTSIVLRKSEPVYTRDMLEPSERKEIDNDINNWMSEMQTREKDLEEGRVTLMKEPFPQPDIRQFKEEIMKKQTVSNAKISNKTKRISSCDYAAWDKYDVDTEINKIDIHDEKERLEIKRFQQKQKDISEEKKTAKDVTINKSSLTGTELEITAEQEREKGNEAFRAGDYEEALVYYNSSIKMDSNLAAFNNRAMTFIKLQRYEDALNDCNLVLSTEYTNIKALLRRAVSLEHLEKSSQALADYEAVLKLEPTNKIAIAGVKKLRKPWESRKVRMIIEEKKENDEGLKFNRVEQNNSRNTRSNTSLSINNSICFCDRAPGPSQNLKPRPHLKAEYCLENENRQKLSTKNNISHIKLSSEKRKHEICSNKNLPESSKNPTTSSSNANDYFSKPFNVMCKTSSSTSTAKPKSIFSYVTPPVSSVIIEEIPNESCDNKNKLNGTANKNDCNTIKPCNGGKVNNSSIKNLNNNQEQNVNSNEKREMKPLPAKKIEVAEKYGNKTSKLEKNISTKFNNIDSPYEFICTWQSLKNDNDLKVHAQLLRSLDTDNLKTGNKLDGTMFSTILNCLEQHFCTPNDSELLHNFLKSFSQVNRFSIISMFMDAEDKRAVKNILNFLEEQGVSEISLLRQVYCI